jgi:hypothetical protein
MFVTTGIAGRLVFVRDCERRIFAISLNGEVLINALKHTHTRHRWIDGVHTHTKIRKRDKKGRKREKRKM